ncbi:MAG: Signal recognition particle receptor FtsY [Firmicutes bacterium ADurb.Bin080]|jgi:fused signal recognition particle receptor|nr:signal recognition particle-docking protein FtsY [Clostridiales bacterium]OQC12680.1 MAG: Signal recognition particle receptor FtsY [Firmicutes bacterium ADurb.Bin080]
MGFFLKLKEGLKKTRENISRKFYEAFKAKELGQEFYDTLELALISADMGYTATENVLRRLRAEIPAKKISKPEEAKALLKRILLETIDYEIPHYEFPLLIFISGVNGVGKTTAVGKLAKLFVSEGKSVVIAAADTFRAAASEQLDVWAERAGVRVISHSEGSDPAAVVFDTLISAKAKGTQVIIIDTAGRLHNKKNLMEELKKINRVIDRELPEADRRNLIVLDATTGQNALRQVEVFNEAIEIDGIILTKLDGTAKGGVVMAIAEEQNIPVYYAGVGEGIDDLIPFDAKDFIDAIFE